MFASSMQGLTAAVYPCSYVMIYAQDAKLFIHFHKTEWISTALLWTVKKRITNQEAHSGRFNINQMIQLSCWNNLFIVNFNK